MRAHCVVVLHVTHKDVAQVLPADHDNMVEAFPADRADQALRTPVLPRRAWRRRVIANAKRANASDEYVAVTSIPIADQIAGDLLPTTGRRQLVGNPFRRWVGGNAQPEDLSPAVTYDQQSIEKPEEVNSAQF
jgi:hypothetical protein